MAATVVVVALLGVWHSGRWAAVRWWEWPLVAAAGAAAGAWIAWERDWGALSAAPWPVLGREAVLAGALVAVARLDWWVLKIPDVFTGGLLGLWAGSLVVLGGEGWLRGLVGAAMGIAALMPVAARGEMGLGDVKLAAVQGLYLGPAGIVVALVVAVVSGGVAGLVRSGWRRWRGQEPGLMAFGPYLALGGLVALAYQ